MAGPWPQHPTGVCISRTTTTTASGGSAPAASSPQWLARGTRVQRDGGPAAKAQLNRPAAVAWGRTPACTSRTRTTTGFGASAPTASSPPWPLWALPLLHGRGGPDGSVYFSEAFNRNVRRIDPGSVLTTAVAGCQADDFAIGPDGSVYLACQQRQPPGASHEPRRHPHDGGGRRQGRLHRRWRSRRAGPVTIPPLASPRIWTAASIFRTTAITASVTSARPGTSARWPATGKKAPTATELPGPRRIGPASWPSIRKRQFVHRGLS